MQGTSDLILVTGRDGCVQYASPSSRQFGYTEDEVLGRSVFEFLHPDDLDRVTDRRGRIADLPWSDVRTARVGGEAIPLLEGAISVDQDGSVHFQLFRAYQLTHREAEARRALSDYQRFRASLAPPR